MQEPPRTLLMGVLNTTPDSFSDGGQFIDIDQAIAHGLQLARDGAAIIDVGGESTRPGSERVSPDQQIKRVVEPIRQLRLALDKQGFEGVTISVDTTLSPVASASLDAGAAMLNDVSAGREDEAMLKLAAERGVPIVLMHMLGSPGTMQDDPQYGDVVEDVLAFLIERADAAVHAGVAHHNIWLDPGIGFGKTLAHNLALLGAMDRFVAAGYPVLLGVSRKRFIAGCCEAFAQPDAGDRLPGTLTANLIGAQAGVHALRIHDVAEHRQAFAVLRAVELNTYRTK
ncbi:MAG: dihydropteroate synthase [Phycisphaeraceae bacterium]|nr:dihydropteroate synthase [Phycisphaeraceae bacterium]